MVIFRPCSLIIHLSRQFDLYALSYIESKYLLYQKLRTIQPILKIMRSFFLLCLIWLEISIQLIAANIVINIYNENFDEHDQKAYFDKLFETRDFRLTNLEPTETLKKLERLRDINRANSNASSGLSPEQKDLINRLIELPGLSACDTVTFDKFTRLLESERRSNHIVAYLDHYKLQLLKSCKVELGKLYYESIANLDPRIRTKISALRNEVKQVTGLSEFGLKIPFYTKQALIEGIGLYLKNQDSRARGRRGLSRDQFDKIYSKEVEFLWHNLNENFKSTSLFFFDQIATDGKLMNALDEFTRDWIIGAYISRDATDNIEVIEEVYKLFKSSSLVRGLKRLAKTLKSN